MALKPVDQRIPGLDSRSAVWAGIRRLRTFTARQAADETRLETASVRDYLRGLTAAGYLERVEDRVPATYRLVRDVGAEAPRVRRDGTPVTHGTGREQLWRTIPIIKAFSALELAVAASTEEHPVAESEAEHYADYLTRAGYLRRSGPGRYRFVEARYPGPLPPQIQRIRQVFDPNSGTVVWKGGAE